MRYVALGSSGLRVSEIALGTMNFGDDRFGIPAGQARKLLDGYAEAGGNLLDTAPVYGLGEAERLLGDFLGAQRHRFVIVSKVGCQTAAGDPNSAGLSRKSVESAVRGILARLRTDYLDLLLVHMDDPLTPAEVWMPVFQSLVERGQVQHWGVSNVPGWVLGEAACLGRARQLPLTAGQVRYSLLHRDAEHELLPALRRWRAGVMAWAPLAGGLLAKTALGPDDTLARRGYTRLDERESEALPRLRQISQEHGLDPAALSLGWLRHRGVIPVVGVRTGQQLAEALACEPIPPQALAALDGLCPPTAPYPQSFLAETRRFTFGDHDVAERA